MNQIVVGSERIPGVLGGRNVITGNPPPAPSTPLNPRPVEGTALVPLPGPVGLPGRNGEDGEDGDDGARGADGFGSTWQTLVDKPPAFPPTPHTHITADLDLSAAGLDGGYF